MKELNMDKIQRNLKVYAVLVLIINILNGLIGIIYVLSQTLLKIWNIFGVVFLVGVLLTMVFTQIVGYYSNKYTQIGHQINIQCYGYLIFLILGCLLMFLSNFIGMNDSFIGNFVLGILIYGSYFGILIYGISLARIVLVSKNKKFFLFSGKNDETSWKLSKKSFKRIKIIRILGIFLFILVLIFGAYTNASILNGIQGGFQMFMIGVFAGQAGLFFGLIFFGASLFIFRAIKIQKRPYHIIKIPVIVIGLTISSICFLPLVTMPQYAQNSDRIFSETFDPFFSGSWEAEIMNSGKSNYFMSSQFALPGYFLGTPNPDCIVKKNVLFLDGTQSNYSVDANAKLYFDAYLPINRGVGLPGENSTLIRIHGGGWTIGDKGLGNVIQMNRYFAAQGYCVFDIQYGLNDGPENMGIPFTPKNVMGNFSLDDMLRHIGEFTKYLELHVDEYGANLNSVFVSGGSAGGQLACATALSIENGSYSNIFSDNFIIKGLIPYYPANNVSMNFAKESKPEWINPEKLVSNQSPPCLIFQGEQDRLIYRARSFENSYLDNSNKEICILTFPYAGHANDLYFPGYYNQVFLYYMERFMFLYH
jgi:acetyl esterase/lipase